MNVKLIMMTIFVGLTSYTYAAQDHNSTRSNRTSSKHNGLGDEVTSVVLKATAIDHNSTRSNRTSSKHNGLGDEVTSVVLKATAIDHNSTRSNRTSSKHNGQGDEVQEFLDLNEGKFLLSSTNNPSSIVLANVCEGKPLAVRSTDDLVATLKSTPNGDTVINILKQKRPMLFNGSSSEGSVAFNLYYKDTCVLLTKLKNDPTKISIQRDIQKR